MWKTIATFFIGLAAGFALFLKMKDPEIVNVSGDLIETQKVKDNRKDKSRTKLSRADKREARKARKALKRANK